MPKGKGIRHCGKCGNSGHYAKTCIDKPTGTVGVSGSASVSKTECGGSIPPRSASLIINGHIVVDKVRYPNLYAALERGKTVMDTTKNQWQKVVDLRKQGLHGSADRVINKILGISKPMSEEAKAKLKEYNKNNKEEIDQRRKARKELQRRTLELVNSGSEKLTRKRGG